MKDFTPPLTPPQGGKLEKSSNFVRYADKIAAKKLFFSPSRFGNTQECAERWAGGWVKTIVNSIKNKMRLP
jgi:hypothetical protein